MRFKNYMELAPGETQPSMPANQPMQQPGTVQQGQQMLPAGTENQEWFKQLQNSGMPEEWKQHYIQLALKDPTPQQGMGMMRQAGRTAMNTMMAPSPIQSQGM